MMNPFKTKKGLGRGLSSLIGDTDSKPIKNKISISSIIRNKFQPRKRFDKEKMDEKLNIQIVADKKITKIIPVPPYSAGYWVYLGAISIASAITSYYATLTPQPTYSYTTY